ncbi:copper resistance protein CopC, partial [Microbispora sp. NPDC049633]|uniref:copper resistance CopC family protein n=1 Tax=Microbispora sp. NPDC049633 TaxID=3154355 RepID=UPI00341F5F27
MARSLGRLLLLIVVGVLTMTALAAPASAHGQLAMSTPVKDSTVREPMKSLALYFTEAPAPNAYFAVTAPSGARVDRPWAHGRPERLDKPVQEYNLVNGTWEPVVYNTGFPAEIPIAYWPERGEYVVRYLSIASDGEPVRGELRFTYKGRTSGAPKGWQAPDNEPDPGLLDSHEPGGGTQTPMPQAGGSLAPGTQAGGSLAPGTQAGGSPAPATQTGGSPAAMGPAAPQAGAGPAAASETGGGQGAVPETGSPGTAARAAQPSDSGSGLSVWLVPAILVVGAGVLVVGGGGRPPPPPPTESTPRKTQTNPTQNG